MKIISITTYQYGFSKYATQNILLVIQALKTKLHKSLILPREESSLKVTKIFLYSNWNSETPTVATEMNKVVYER